MNLIGWHATRNAKAILADGKIRPTRLPCVYLFSTELSALCYAREFGYVSVVRSDYETSDVSSVWMPRYAHGASVIRLKPGRTAIPRSVQAVVDALS